MPRTGRPATRTVQSVDRGLVLLWMVAEAPAGVGVVEASERLRVDPSTVSRLLASLVGADLVVRDPLTGRYRMSPGALRLAASVPLAFAAGERELRQAGRRTLYLLEEATGETVVLAVRAEGRSVLVDAVPTRRTAPYLAAPNPSQPLHCTAEGKALLAWAPPEVAARELQGVLERVTARTLTDLATLRAQLAEVRRLGFATAEGESAPGQNAIAAPVEGASGEVVAALGIRGPAERFDRIAMRRGLDLLLPRADELSRNLGARLPSGDPFA